MEEKQRAQVSADVMEQNIDKEILTQGLIETIIINLTEITFFICDYMTETIYFF